MMPTFSGYTSYAPVGGATSFTVDPSANLVSGSVSVGDWIIIVFTTPSNLPNSRQPTPPSGWTTIVPMEQVGSGTMCIGIWTHQYVSGDTTYSWTQTNSQFNGLNYAMMFVRGADDISNWIIGSFDFRQDTGTPTTNVAASISTTSSNNLALLLSGERTTTSETSSQVSCVNFTAQFFENLVDQSLFVATKNMPSVGSTGSSTVTYPNPHNNNGIAGIISIPAPNLGVDLMWVI